MKKESRLVKFWAATGSGLRSLKPKERPEGVSARQWKKQLKGARRKAR